MCEKTTPGYARQVTSPSDPLGIILAGVRKLGVRLGVLEGRFEYLSCSRMLPPSSPGKSARSAAGCDSDDQQA
jgi:hypothetical protein